MSFKIRDEHWEVMLAFFETNKELALGRFTGINGREKGRKLWNQLANELNAIGFGERTADKWQKTWTDLKYLIKKKGSKLRKDQITTGGGLGDSAPFNKFELRALSILGDTFFQGVGESELSEASTSQKSQISEVTVEKENFERIPFRKGPSTSKNTKGVFSGSSTSKDDDHSYATTPKRRKIVPVEEAYQETIMILTDIRNVVGTRLGQIVQSIDNLQKAIMEKK